MAFGLVAGAIIGSFIATLVLRWPRGRSVTVGRSACDGCHRVLTPRDLVPLLSYSAARGRCRTCHAPIDWRHPAIEAAAGAIGVLSLAISPDTAGLALALFGWQLLALGWLDAEHFWLPDRLVLLLAVTGVSVALFGVPPSLADRLIGAAAGFGSLWLIGFAYEKLRGRTGLGGGDPKLLCAIGAWLGWQMLPFVLIGASATGLAWVALRMMRGEAIAATDRVPLGTLMALAAFALAGWVAT